MFNRSGAGAGIPRGSRCYIRRDRTAARGTDAASVVACGGEEEDLDGRDPQEESRTLCRETMLLEDEPSRPPPSFVAPAPPAAGIVLASPAAAPPPERYQHEAAC